LPTQTITPKPPLYALHGLARFSQKGAAMNEALALATAISAFAGIDKAGGELPKSVVPSLYSIDLAPDVKTGKIAGYERIEVTFRNPAKSVSINALQTSFESVTLDGKPARAVPSKSEQITDLIFPSLVAVGTHELRIAYTATLQQSPQGLFVERYRETDGKPRYMYATQFEATDARRMFPSFDEPAFKARFAIGIVIPKTWTAISNMPAIASKPAGEGRKRVRFATTPPMSTYLVALAAGDFDVTRAISDGVQLAVYATRGNIAQERYAIDVMKTLMPYYDAYYGVKYPLPKLDAIAIPGSEDAMENWGLITYGEDSLLFDPNEQPESAKRDIFDVIAHEESHLWNGDLTTMPWWNELWLNEGFATWMETKATDRFNPQWQYSLSADRDVNGAMETDALASTHPIDLAVRNEFEAAGVFDDISYTKAGAILRMLERYLGPEVFRAGLQRYFKTHEYGLASAADLWSDLSAVSGKDVAAIAHAWIYEAGFPLVSVTASCDAGKRTLSLSQKRYLFDASSDSGTTVWQIPMNVEIDARDPKPVAFLMSGKTTELDGGRCEDPLVLNGNDVGYYRVSYDAATQSTQRASFSTLSVADRLGLLDDSWAFVASGRDKIDAYLAYVEADAADNDPHVVDPILGNLERLLAIERGRPGEPALQAYVAARLRPTVARFGGWEGLGMSDEQLQARNHALELLAASGDRATIDEGLTRFRALTAGTSKVSPLERDAIVRVAGYGADRATFEQLLQLARSTSNQDLGTTYLFAAYHVREKTLAMEGLEDTLHLQQRYSSFAPVFVAEIGRTFPQQAWSFLTVNSQQLLNGSAEFTRAQALADVASTFSRSIPPDQIEAFLKARVPPDGAREVTRAMADVRARRELQERLLPEIDAYVAEHSSATTGRNK
jgi:aminopeptidase N